MTQPCPDLVIRPAQEAELPRIWGIRYANEIADLVEPPAAGAPPASLRHLLDHGTLLVAERDGEMLGFGARIERSGVAFLTDLFVEPDVHSVGVGRTLMEHLFADGIPARSTIASTDHRAIALYTRMGMTPRWPIFDLVAESARLRLRPPGVELIPVMLADSALREWDCELSGRDRPQDLAFFAQRQGGCAFWVERAGCRVGYAIVRQDAALLAPVETMTVGPVGGRTPEDAADALLATVGWASRQAPRIELSLPGPHPALPVFLAAGGQIAYVETFCASRQAMNDPERYATSGGDLN